jgi:hypothetical protein
MKFCQLVGCGHGSKGLVEVNNIPAKKKKKKTANIKTCGDGAHLPACAA